MEGSAMPNEVSPVLLNENTSNQDGIRRSTSFSNMGYSESTYVLHELQNVKWSWDPFTDGDVPTNESQGFNCFAPPYNDDQSKERMYLNDVFETEKRCERSILREKSLKGANSHSRVSEKSESYRKNAPFIGETPKLVRLRRWQHIDNSVKKSFAIMANETPNKTLKDCMKQLIKNVKLPQEPRTSNRAQPSASGFIGARKVGEEQASDAVDELPVPLELKKKVDI